MIKGSIQEEDITIKIYMNPNIYAFNITVIQVYAPNSNNEELKLNGSVKTYKTF